VGRDDDSAMFPVVTVICVTSLCLACGILLLSSGGTDMQDQDCVASAKALKARAAEFLTQARETNDPWFVEQLSRLAEDLNEYADALENRSGA
jgi:hypothetical protein